MQPLLETSGDVAGFVCIAVGFAGFVILLVAAVVHEMRADDAAFNQEADMPKLDVEKAKEFLRAVLPIAELLAARTQTTADDTIVAILRAWLADPALIQAAHAAATAPAGGPS